MIMIVRPLHLLRAVALKNLLFDSQLIFVYIRIWKYDWKFSKENIFCKWNLKENTAYVFVPNFQSQYCKGYGLSTINICFNFRKLLCTSSHCNMWAWLCCTAWIGSFKTWISSSRTTAIWGGEYSSNRGIVWTRTNSQWWQHDNFLNKILRLPDIEICILVSQTNSYNYDWRVSPSSGSS